MTTARVLLAVPLPKVRPGAQRYTVQVQQRSADARAQLLYRAFTVVDGPLAVPSLAVSGDGRWLSYSDGQFRLHLVSLSQGRDRIIGRGMMPQFSYDGRFVAFLTGRILPLSSPGPQAEHLLLFNLQRATLTMVRL